MESRVEIFFAVFGRFELLFNAMQVCHRLSILKSCMAEIAAGSHADSMCVVVDPKTVPWEVC